MDNILENLTILIVDDNPTNLAILSETLTNQGFQVAIATDGESTLEQIEYVKPELILLDVMMPGISGFETCRRIKAHPELHDIPVIFMTALDDLESKMRGFSLQAVDYITKPFQQGEVIARINTHLNLRCLTKKLEVQNNLLKQFNENLERKVAERTTELQQAHIQLVQQEKLSSLGQLVAGIAHEINNPINFIYGNFPPARKYTQDLLELVHLYQAEYPNPTPQIREKLEEMDFEFLCEDLPSLIQSMKVGAERVREIVLSLRNFSRLDEAEFKSVNIHDGIDSTLMILHHRLKATSDHSEIVVIKDYGNLPSVSCYPGQLNQVLMNLVTNAIDALDEQRQTQSCKTLEENPATIRIYTEVLSQDWVAIHIADNGPGIPENIQNKIFEPFFTTKPINQGTGLGLSISYQIIVERHGGMLRCCSTPGQGTEFVIELPLQHPQECQHYSMTNPFVSISG
jgi:signal transduction histidine kinase